MNAQQDNLSDSLCSRMIHVFGEIKMISIEKFIEIHERFGHFASWAMWADEGANPKDNIDDLEVLGVSNPVLVASGKDTEKIAKRNLRQEFRIIGIPHYANYISKDNYRAQVYSQLSKIPDNKNTDWLSSAVGLRGCRPPRLHELNSESSGTPTVAIYTAVSSVPSSSTILLTRSS